MSSAGLANYVTYNPRSASPTTTLAEGLRMMDRYGCRHLPVVDHRRRVIGLVSDLDLALAMNPGAGRANSQALPPDGATLASVMATRVVTVDESASPREALAAIVASGFHSVPVVVDGELVGMVTSTDFLREISYGELPCGAEPVGRHTTAPAGTLDAAAPLSEALEVLDGQLRQYVMIVRQQMPLGVLSVRDIHRARLTMDGHFSPATGWPTRGNLSTVGDAFAGQPIVFTLEQTLAQAAACLVERGLRAVTVADDCVQPAGVLREDDLLAALLQGGL